MKLNELFEREFLHLSSAKQGDINYGDSKIICYILSKITGKISYYLQVPSIISTYGNLNILPTSEEELKKIRDFYEEVVTEFNLTKSMFRYRVECGDKYYSPNFVGYENNTDLVDQEEYLFGDGIVCFVGVDITRTISGVFYTEDSKDLVKKIWKKHSEMCKKILDEHKEDLVKSYEIVTVSVSSDGRYVPSYSNISPVVSLDSPDFLENYNENLPESKIQDFLKMDRGGIMIFNGIPGCGKSTYLKYLITKNTKDSRFVLLPQYLLTGQEQFRNFLIRMSREEKECIYIVEDCEQLLLQRESNTIQFSSILGDILNYTDGIFGDLTRTKFIFTFNTDLKNIDKAILRPGRLFLKYEFSTLIGERLEKLAARLEYPLKEEEKKTGLTLAELYSKAKSSDIIIEKNPRRKVGFATRGKISESRDAVGLG